MSIRDATSSNNGPRSSSKRDTFSKSAGSQTPSNGPLCEAIWACLLKLLLGQFILMKRASKPENSYAQIQLGCLKNGAWHLTRLLLFNLVNSNNNPFSIVGLSAEGFLKVIPPKMKAMFASGHGFVNNLYIYLL